MTTIMQNIRNIIVSSIVLVITPALALGNDFMPMEAVTHSSFTGLNQNSTLGYQYNRQDADKPQRKRRKVKRNDLLKVLLGTIFPEKIFHLKRLGPQQSQGLARSQPKYKTQLQFGLMYQGTKLKMRARDDKLGMSLGGRPGSSEEKQIGIAYKIKW